MADLTKQEQLDKRKMSILKALVDDYVTNAEPVGSRTIATKYDMGISSATIRNEMADLEDMGYLTHPHTSAGRVPSDKGYRTYVNSILADKRQDTEELLRFKNYLETRINEFHDIIKVASGLLSRIVPYAAVSMVSSVSTLTVKAVQLVPIESGKALAVVVMSNDAIKNKMVRLDTSVTPEDVLRLSSIVNDQFEGLAAETVKDFSINDLMMLMGSENLRILPLIDAVIDCILQCGETEVYHEGESNILMHPEFEDVSKAKTMLEVLHSDDVLKDIFTSDENPGGLTIRIGSENEMPDMKDCSVISATYSINDTSIGTIGVLGPKRMNYAKVISALEFIRRRLNRDVAAGIKDRPGRQQITGRSGGRNKEDRNDG